MKFSFQFTVPIQHKGSILGPKENRETQSQDFISFSSNTNKPPAMGEKDRRKEEDASKREILRNKAKDLLLLRKFGHCFYCHSFCEQFLERNANLLP